MRTVRIALSFRSPPPSLRGKTPFKHAVSGRGGPADHTRAGSLAHLHGWWIAVVLPRSREVARLTPGTPGADSASGVPLSSDWTHPTWACVLADNNLGQCLKLERARCGRTPGSAFGFSNPKDSTASAGFTKPRQ